MWDRNGGKEEIEQEGGGGEGGYKGGSREGATRIITSAEDPSSFKT